MSNYQFPESVLFAAISAANESPVEQPLTIALSVIEDLRVFIDAPRGRSTLYCIRQYIDAITDRAHEEGVEYDIDPELCLREVVAHAIAEQWQIYTREQLDLLMGSDANWDLADPMFRETQCRGKVEVEEDDTLALEDAADLADTPF